MMNFGDLERAHLTLAFLRQMPAALDVKIAYRPAREQISAMVLSLHNTVRRYTFQIGSDDDCYLFVNDEDITDIIAVESLPASLLYTID